MKIWKIVRDTDYDTSANIYADEATARAAFASEVAQNWDHFMGKDVEMPDDPDEAWERITTESSCVDTLYLAEDELTLPPVYEAGPELLAALCEADSYLQGWYDDDMQEGMGELQEIVDSAMAKAKGEVPRPWALQAAAPDMLEALRTIEEYLHRDDNGNAETYADIFEVIDKAIAKAEGRT